MPREAIEWKGPLWMTEEEIALSGGGPIKFNVIGELSASEALRGFNSWLLCRSERPNTAVVSMDDLITMFCKSNHLVEPREGWHRAVVYPEEHECQR